MKKLLIILLSVAMIFTFTACNEETNSNATTVTENTAEVVQTTEEESTDTTETTEPAESEEETNTTEQEAEEVVVEDTGEEVVEDTPDVESIPVSTNYKWLGEYNLAPGTYVLEFGPRVSDFMSIAFMNLDEVVGDPKAYAAELFTVEDREKINLENELKLEPGKVFTLEMGEQFGQFGIVVEEAGRYGIATEEAPEDTEMALMDMSGNEVTPTTVE